MKATNVIPNSEAIVANIPLDIQPRIKGARAVIDRPIHPACAIWPRPSDEEVRALAEDIKVWGLKNPIWYMPNGAIIDGKTRYEACQMVGVGPVFSLYTGDDPVAFTISQNAKRRHQSSADLALAVADLVKLPHGGNHGNQYTSGKLLASNLPNRERAADLAAAAGIGVRNVYAAKVVLEDAEPNIIEMVRKGEIGVQSAAAFVAHTSRQEQRYADVKTIRKSGYDLRTPMRKLAKREEPKPSEKMVSIQVLIEELHPLFERVLAQSKVHIAMVSRPELAMIAGEGQRLLDRWASDDITVRRLGGHVVPFKRPTGG